MQLLNDIAWLQFLGVIAPFYFVVITIIYASFADSDEKDPIIPRWVGWFNVFFMFDLIPLASSSSSSPGFYLPFATFWIWFFVMTYTRAALAAPTRRRDPLVPHQTQGVRS